LAIAVTSKKSLEKFKDTFKHPFLEHIGRSPHQLVTKANRVIRGWALRKRLVTVMRLSSSVITTSLSSKWDKVAPSSQERDALAYDALAYEYIFFASSQS